jgi:hypothetical protein
MPVAYPTPKPKPKPKPNPSPSPSPSPSPNPKQAEAPPEIGGRYSVKTRVHHTSAAAYSHGRL